VSLEAYGWSDAFRASFDALEKGGLEPARVVLATRSSCRVVTATSELAAPVAGRLRREGSSPAVGDWVAVDPEARLVDVLPRRTKLSRKAAGKTTEEQVVAANVDRVFVVMGLDADFNVRRVERFLSTVWESGARPVVLLTKLDLCPEADARKEEVEDVAPGVDVLALSSVDGRGLEELEAHLVPRETSVLVGSSGVGKSTLINRLLGREQQRTREVRRGDGRGQHVTSHRELFVLPGGALLVDNPGIREIQLWGGDESLDRAFEDVALLARSCRFRDCTHRTEPGCAVTAAAESGALSPERLESYRSLERELRYLHLRQDESAQREEKRKWRAIHRELRRAGRHRRT
jgi:ribosome biogenesis GTPase